MRTWSRTKFPETSRRSDEAMIFADSKIGYIMAPNQDYPLRHLVLGEMLSTQG